MARETCPAMLMITSSPAPDSAVDSDTANVRRSNPPVPAFLTSLASWRADRVASGTSRACS
jgi:hypothetical protein